MGQCSMARNTREIQPGVRCSSIARHSRCKAVPRLTIVGRFRARFHQHAVEPGPRPLSRQRRLNVAVVLQIVANDERRPMLRDAAGRESAARCRRLRSSRRCGARSALLRHTGPMPAACGISFGEACGFRRVRLSRSPDVRPPGVWYRKRSRYRARGDQSASRSTNASVPSVDLALPRGPTTLIFMPAVGKHPAFVVHRQTATASQRCICDGGRRKCSGRKYRPQSKRSAWIIVASDSA